MGRKLRYFLIRKGCSTVGKPVSESDYQKARFNKNVRAGFHGQVSRKEAKELIKSGDLKPDFVNDAKLRKRLEYREEQIGKAADNAPTPIKDMPTPEERERVLEAARNLKRNPKEKKSTFEYTPDPFLCIQRRDGWWQIWDNETDKTIAVCPDRETMHQVVKALEAMIATQESSRGDTA